MPYRDKDWGLYTYDPNETIYRLNKIISQMETGEYPNVGDGGSYPTKNPATMTWRDLINKMEEKN